MRELLYGQIEDNRDEFSKVNQEGCDYDKERLNIAQGQILDLEGRLPNLDPEVFTVYGNME